MSRALAGFDAWQRRRRPAAFVVAVAKKFGEDRASSHAALVAYYAFLSLFPLLLALTSVLGFVLEDDPSLQDDIVDTALGRIPVIGAQLRDDVQPLTGSGVALAIGIVGALWAGLGVTLALGPGVRRRSGTCRASSSRARSGRGSAASWCSSRSWWR